MVQEDTQPAEQEMGLRRFTVEISEGVHLQVQVLLYQDVSPPDILPVPQMELSRDAAADRQLLTGFVKLANHLLKL